MKMRLHKRLTRTLRQILRKRILSRHGTAILADTWNGLLLVEAGDFHVGRTLLKEGSYDRRELEWLLAGLDNPAPVIVVVGAHIGSLLIPLAKTARKLIGFEPDRKNFSLLQQNLLLNRIDNTTLHKAAVGAGDGSTAFARNRLNTGNSGIATRNSEADVEVPLVSLDTALATLVDNIDLLVMDIEGYELQALRGGERTLARTRKLYIEYAPEHLREHGCEPADLLALLASSFNHLYMLEADGVAHMTAGEGSQALLSQARRRGFLKNLLFTREPLQENSAGAFISAPGSAGKTP